MSATPTHLFHVITENSRVYYTDINDIIARVAQPPLVSMATATCVWTLTCSQRSRALRWSQPTVISGY